jgi:hypothetical protein
MIKTLVLAGVLALGPVQEAAKKAFDVAEKAVLGVKNVVTPKVEECPCEGKGFIVHGDGHKTSCPGTEAGPCKFRRAGDVQVEEVYQHATIIMYSAKDNPDGTNPCIWCVRWKKEAMPVLLLNKWKVIERVGAQGKGVPYFEIYLFGKKYEHNGYMGSDALKKIVERARQEAKKKK